MKTLGTKIRLLRVTLGLTQEELATKLHTGGAVVSNWELMRTLPQPRFLPQLARVLGCEASELATLWMADSIDTEGKE